MWISDSWQDFAVLDCSRGEKLERWGKYTLVRPDPQAIWDTPRRHPGWKPTTPAMPGPTLAGGRWVKKDLPQRWQVHYRTLPLILSP